MLKRLYDWTLALAARKTAEVWLAVIAFVESSVFLIPADVLFLPMALARPSRAYRFALIATVASVLGGIAGYMLGHYAFAALAKARGCRVVGIAGGPDKCQYATAELGFDACIDYKLHADAGSLSKAIAQAFRQLGFDEVVEL